MKADSSGAVWLWRPLYKPSNTEVVSITMRRSCPNVTTFITTQIEHEAAAIPQYERDGTKGDSSGATWLQTKQY